MKPIKTHGIPKKVAWKQVKSDPYRWSALGMAMYRPNGTWLVPDTNEILYGVDYHYLSQLLSEFHWNDEIID